MDFKDKKITVMGIGLHGGSIAMIKFLVARGAKVIATDIKTKEQLAPSLEQLKGVKNVQYVLGQHRREDFTNVDMVIKNPAVPWSDEHIKFALEKNIPVEMDSSLFFKLCKNPIIGVTGSKGKTTTAKMIYDLLKSTGRKPIKVGIGQISVIDKLERLEKDSVVVFEFSSWRLSALGREKLSPHIAVITNILQDHLNYYKTMEKYVADKKYIFSNQKPKDWLVINSGDEKVVEISKDASSQFFRFSNMPIKESPSVFIEDGYIFLNDGVDTKKLSSINDIKILGRHNLMNVLAAIGAAYAFGINFEEIRTALSDLEGVPHRLEFVRRFSGVEYYNDTAATIPDAAILALEAFEKPLILIAGGADKNLDFKEFALKIFEKARNVILLEGTATEKIMDCLKKVAPEEFVQSVRIASSMESAVAVAKSKAQPGDVVLLSPGAASFGLFNNEFDRGDKFKKAIMSLK
ncbi:MAG TPA: UDP-N-acetylmuramoyl-L-alanine--D-glutamate ligase [Candidatus Moranbacteria bacterium]|jgi:UDP-N-acetylmuramoylalanine--D-glutamate ligase|nr:UDP-N-acetylmuramoyl-L-alanine--D-glutamate ligase [Candidatus Moranbacteria bacterium]HOF42650.1 UDP-N-acetylmuramoyl-L-alanine--D-glutamate ligase [Candidatus Moranbacteria bacterium]HPX94748.1 UDP-N-acetylmuramoyl-L-alanine--D-glutamate ligase [Candidatus Moranbacteria bacterium]HQB59927.1 UDP-N-acetylmuramoyl-L-alanine--D-glutamate ligase [Candidatus Moranbacteria bacterium]